MTAYIAIIVALISAAVSIYVAFRNQKAQRELEELKSALADQSKERDARRDYEYEARKRLYEELEPVLFKLVETADEAWYRVLSLARSARLGSITPASGWLFSTDGYFLVSTMHRLFAPMAVIGLMQEKLTLVDLTLERRLRDQYYLAKALERTFTDDFAIAGFEPKLPYEWDVPDQETARKTDPKVHWPQGLPLGRLDIAAAAMIAREGEAPPRLMRFGQFSAEYANPQSAVRAAFTRVGELFYGFHPESRPVLWRILVTQAVMLRALARIRSMSREDTFNPLQKLSEKEAALLQWWSGDSPSDEALLKQTLAIAYTHIQRTFNQIAGK